MRGLESVSGLGVLDVQGEDSPAAASFLCARAVSLVGQEVVEGRQQKGAELALFRAGALQAVPLQQGGEERLRAVLGLVRVTASPA